MKKARCTMCRPCKLETRLSTRGATDFHGFTIDGTTFLAVSNEQDDVGGGDIESTIWALHPLQPS